VDIQQTRRAQLREVIEKQGGAASVAKRLGWTVSYIGQLTKGVRPITEKTARRVEEKLLLKRHALDGETVNGAAFEGVDHALLGKAIVAVAEGIETTHAQLTPQQQADLISAVYEHAVTSKEINPRFVEQLIRMTR